MAVENFIYQGINRAVSDYTGARMCEELINLRPTDGGLVPVRDFTAKMSNKPFFRVFVHHTTAGDKYIAVWKDGSTVKATQVTEDGTVIASPVLFSTPYTDDAAVGSIHYATAGNILVFSMCDTVHAVFKNTAWTWKQGGYEATEANIPPVTFTISDGTDPICVTEDIQDINKDTDPNEVVSVIESGFNAMQEKNPEVCFGPVIIAMAFKTKDGKTFWTNDWRIYDPTGKVAADTPPYVDYSMVQGEIPEYQDFFSKYGYGFIVNNFEDLAIFYVNSLHMINGYGTKVTLSFPKLTSGWNKDTSIIESVEIYSSRPVLYMDTAAAYEGFKWFPNQLTPGTYFYTMVVPPKNLADMDLGGQLLYHQATILLSSLADSAQDVVLTFGGNVQVSEDTLDTDAGALTRFGDVLSYNARFHYYNSVSHIDIGMPSFRFPPRTSHNLGTMEVFVRYTDADRSDFLWVGTLSNIEGFWPANLVIAPTINIKEVVTYTNRNGTYYTNRYRMRESSTYNFSICDTGPYDAPAEGRNTELENLIPNNRQPEGITTTEPDAINVTEQYNPFVFLVEHSYKAPGNIIDVQPQMAGITDVSYGRDPLSVSTERGLYNLTLGSANVLYGAFVSVANIVAKRGGIPTEMGVFFLGDGGLWLIAGRRATLVSEALSLGPHKYVRADRGYKKLSGTDTPYSPTPAPANPVYDVSPYLSQVEFKDFVEGARLSYNRFRMEIFISNEDYEYSYVLSLKYRQWFKVSKRLWQDDPGSVIINRPGTVSGTISVLDMAQEVSMSTVPLLVHMQSRPFSMGYQYSHVHRIVAMMRAMLPSANHKVAVGLYGSDDLQDWKLLAYAKRSGKTEYDEQSEELIDTPLYLSQVRTPSSARSWRYYTVCIGGEIPVDPDFPTDIGPVLVDYEPVVRRIG